MATHERSSFKDVEMLRVGRYGSKLNTACIVYRIGDTVIDTGPPNQWRKVRRFLKERAISRVVITHHHEDHGGNAGRIKKKWQTPVLIQKNGITHLEKGFPVPFYRRVVWGKPRLRFRPDPLPDQIEVDRDFRLVPVPCPGHAEDMTCFLEPNRGWVFSGDLYIARRPKYLRRVEDPNQEIDSLRCLLTHPFDTVFCSHGGVIRGGRQAIKDKLQYLVALREQVGHYLQTGDPVREIKKRLLGREAMLYFISMGDFSKMNFVKAFARYHRQRAYLESNFTRDLEEELGSQTS